MENRQENTNNDPRAKLFVGGLNRETTNETLREYFEAYGELTDVVVICDSATKKSRGFGYVTFADYKVTRNVLKDKVENGAHRIDGKEVEVKRAIPRDDNSATSHEKTKKIFVGGLPEDATKEDIQEAIESLLEEKVDKVDLIMKKEDETKHRGFAFVELNNEDQADELCCVKKIHVKGKMVEAKKATPRDRNSPADGGRGGYGGRGRGGGGRGGYGGGGGYGGYGGYDQYSGGGYGGYGDSYGSYGGGGGYGSSYGSYDGYGSMGMYNQSSSGYGKSYGGMSGGGSGGRGRGGGRYTPY